MPVSGATVGGTGLTTERLILRRFQKTDAPAMMAVLGDPEVMRFSDGVMDASGVDRWIRWVGTEGYDRVGYGHWAVCLGGGTETSEATAAGQAVTAPVGYCGVMPDPLCAPDEAALGYRLARHAWGRGYGREAADAVLTLALNPGPTGLRLRRVIALVDPGNRASIRVAEGIGMRHVRDISLPGYDHPDRLYVADGTDTNPADRAGGRING